MEIVHPRCCGIDIHKASVCCCISIKEGGKAEKQKRRFDTTTGQLREMAAWLKGWKVNEGGDGSHWSLLEAGLESALDLNSEIRN